MNQPIRRMFGFSCCLLLVYVPAMLSRQQATNVHYVPSSAHAGHVINVFHGQPQQISKVEDKMLSKYFMIKDNDKLVTISDISHLAGKIIPLSVRHQVANNEWFQKLFLHVQHNVGGIQFENQPYIGHVSENQPLGSTVQDLPISISSLKRLIYTCGFKLVSKDTEVFDLKLTGQFAKVQLVTKVMLDRERKSSYDVTIIADCSGYQAFAPIIINVDDENDNWPKFDQDFYSGEMQLDKSENMRKIITVHATDDDVDDDITYYLSDRNFFDIDPNLGHIYVSDKVGIKAKTYSLEAWASDKAHHMSKSIPVTISILPSVAPVTDSEHGASRVRRASHESRTVVIRRTDTGELFKVTSYPMVDGEKYYFKDPAPVGLVLDENTGMVSKDSGHSWNGTTIRLDFVVNVTKVGDDDYLKEHDVTVHLVDRDTYSPLFVDEDEPLPLWTVVPVWIRPDTTIFTVHSIDEVEYGAHVKYKLESGGEGHFGVNPKTGEVFVVGRRMFEAGKKYELAISAENIWAAGKEQTPVQILGVKVDTKDPQFWSETYNVDMPEDTTVGASVTTVRAKSFFDLDLKYTMEEVDDTEPGVFDIDSSTGVITLSSAREYVRNEQQYWYEVKVVEAHSDHEQTVMLFINLEPVNRHPPVFPASHYVINNVKEAQTSKNLLTVSVFDVDPGNYGDVTFSSDDDHFEVEKTGRQTGVINIIKELDYDAWKERPQYTFTITASDGGDPSLTGTASALVFVTNENDNPPVLRPPVQMVEVKADTVPGILLHIVDAYDLDGDLLTFTAKETLPNIIEFSNAGEVKLVNLISGHGDFQFNFTVTDGGVHTVEGTIEVIFMGVNHPPRFEQCSNYDPSIQEGKPAGTPILQIIATDDDAGSMGKLSYDVVVETHREEQHFNLTMEAGEAVLENMNVFDREDPHKEAVKVNGQIKYKVTVIAEDQGNPPLSTTCFFLVSIVDKNDKYPQFDEGTYNVHIRKDTPIDGSVIRVYAVDDDAEGTPYSIVTYKIEDDTDCPGCFKIDQNTGFISVASAISDSTGEDIKLTVSASDQDSTPKTTTTEVKIKLLDDNGLPPNDLPPTWNKLGSTDINDRVITIPENFQYGDRLPEIFRATPQPGLQTIYHAKPGRTPQENVDNTFVAITNTSEMFMTLQVYRVDYEDVSSYTIRLRASHGITESTYMDTRLQVNLKDLNDQVPEFQGLDINGKYPAAVSQQTKVDDPVVTVYALDLDGTPPNNVVTYSWGPSCTDHCQYFKINSNTGLITANSSYDRKNKRQYNLHVQAQDNATSAIPGVSGPNKRLIWVTVEVMGASMKPPYLKNDYRHLTIDEGALFNKEVVKWEAEDPDKPLNIKRYAITSGNDYRKFSVNRETGEIFVTGELLYKDQEMYNMTYRVFDGSVESTSQLVVTVNSINMFPPVFDAIPDVTDKYENVAPPPGIPEVSLGKVTATDPDGSGSMSYRLAGNLYEENSGHFRIDGNSGEVFLTNHLDRDYPEGHDNWIINVVANDNDGTNGKDGYGVLNIRLQDQNDNKPKFDVSSLRGNVNEDATLGRSVMILKATDLDSGDNAVVEFEIIESPKDDSGNDIFKLGGPDNDIVQVAVGNPFNRAEDDMYELKVKASDKGTPPPLFTEKSVWIHIMDVNDNLPKFTTPVMSFDVPEELPLGASVAELSATDEDEGKNAERIYAIVPTHDSFEMDSIIAAGTGVIRMKKRVDYETSSDPITLTVTVQHPTTGPKDTATVTLNIKDVNDNAPAFSPPDVSTSRREDIGVGTTVQTMSATDPDLGDGGKFKYTIDYENTDQKKQFKVTEDQTGAAVVTVRKLLDRETTETHVIHVLAIDQGEPSTTGTGTLTVTLQDVNDNAPDFEQTYMPVVGKDTTSGEVIQKLKVVDSDTDANGSPFTVRIECNDMHCSDFELTDGDGPNIYNLKSKRNGFDRKDYQGKKHLDIPVRMQDSGSPPQNELRNLRVIIASYNDNPPRSGEKQVLVYNYKAKLPESSLGNVFVDEEDDWDLADKTFEFDGKEPEDYGLDSDTGELFMKPGARSGKTRLRVKVKDSVHNTDVISTVVVDCIYIDYEAVFSSGSMRLNDITAEELISGQKSKSSKYDALRSALAKQLDTHRENVHIFSVRDTDGEERKTDVMFSAHGSPWYRPARLNGIVWANKDKIETDADIQIDMAPIDTCKFEECFDSGCHNYMDVTYDPVTVNTNQTSFVGVDAKYTAKCECGPRTFHSTPMRCGPHACLNNGTCHEAHEKKNNEYCDCLDGFDGPRCQQTKHSFNGKGWAWYEPLSQCEDDKLSLEFVTLNPDGLLLYNGPMYDNEVTQDYISVELIGGYPRVRVDLGEGEIALTIDGKNSKGEQKLNALDDGKWHSIEIFKQAGSFQMVIDHCNAAEVTEDINDSVEDRKACEALGEVEGDSFLLNVFTPLELGGRSHPDVSYPKNLQGSYTGCIKNLEQNGMLYDLNIGKKGEHENTEDGCPDEIGCEECSVNSTCVGSLVEGDTGTCVCLPGYGGADCEHMLQSLDFVDSDSFIHWNLAGNINQTAIFRNHGLQLMFRTRKEKGTIFDANSFSTLERMKLEVVDKVLYFRCDMGSGDHVISLPDVDVSDGLWHTVVIWRSGNHVMLRLDGGEGRFYGESVPSNGHRLIKLGSDAENDFVFGAANVWIQKYSNLPMLSNVLESSCVNDIRLANKLIPLHQKDEGPDSAATIITSQNTQAGCGSNACPPPNPCPEIQSCVDLWRMHECRCPRNMTKNPDDPEICLLILDCSYNPCIFGDCVMTDGGRRCNCWTGYYGEFCGLRDPEQITGLSASLTNGAIAAIVVCAILVLLILLLFLFLSMKKKTDYLLDVDPEDDIRENVLYYNEEGVGEEDQHAYDLTRLQKPVDPYAEKPHHPDEPVRRYDDLGRMAPEPMHEGRRLPPPGEYPDVGDFITDRLGDANDDPSAPPYDSVREYEYEGAGSLAGTLSSLVTSSSGDQDFDYLNDCGPRFKKLADLYGGVEDEEESNV